VEKFTRIFLIGPMAAGKTTLGKELSALLGYQFIDADLFLKQQLHNPDIFQQYGENFFRAIECLVLEQCARNVNMVFATGGGCILQAINRRLLQQCGIVCYLKVTPQEQIRRLAAGPKRAILPADKQQWLAYFSQTMLKRATLYESIADYSFDTEESDVTSLAISIMTEIREHLCI
jgi:shikimate kinase